MSKSFRIIFHVGLPKTGSSALQIWADANRRALRAQGINYPTIIGEEIVPKHQFLVPALMSNQLACIDRLIEENKYETLFLSTEGLSNHLYDFPEKSLEAFRALTASIDLKIFMVIRDPEAWTRSFYKQSVINPPIAAYGYATPLRYEAFQQLPRVLRLTNTARLTREIQAAYGASEVVVARYEADWLNDLEELLRLKIDETFTPIKQSNKSVSDDLIELIRQVNAMKIPSESRKGFLSLLQNVLKTEHNILKLYAQEMSGASIAVSVLTDILLSLKPENKVQSDLIEMLSVALVAIKKEVSSIFNDKQ